MPRPWPYSCRSAAPDAVILQVDFSNEALASAGLRYLMSQLLRAQPALYCIVLAEHGSEMSAVRA
jgi:hypothetical protein